MIRLLASIRILALCLILPAGLILFPGNAFASTDVVPGAVTAIISNTPGSPVFSFHANATGWSRGTINVSYEMDVAPAKSGPWAYYTSDSAHCTSATSCSTVSYSESCNGAWYRMTAKANGAGGNAENNPSVVIKHVYASIITRTPGNLLRVTPDRAGVTTALVPVGCGYPSTPI